MRENQGALLGVQARRCGYGLGSRSSGIENCPFHEHASMKETTAPLNRFKESCEEDHTHEHWNLAVPERKLRDT